MAGRGRPGPASVLTHETREQIRLRLASGCTFEVAAQSIGVDARTVRTWMAAGREALDRLEQGRNLTAREKECLELVVAEQSARAEVRVKALASIQKAGISGSWQASAWLLERMFPDEFASTKAGRKERPNAGRPTGAQSAPDRQQPAKLRIVGDG